jgi:hypothetical protein
MKRKQLGSDSESGSSSKRVQLSSYSIYQRDVLQKATLFWVQGIPGSGKSWLGASCASLGLAVLEADDILSAAYDEWRTTLDPLSVPRSSPYVPFYTAQDLERLEQIKVKLLTRRILEESQRAGPLKDLILVGCTVPFEPIREAVCHLYRVVRCIIRLEPDSCALFEPGSIQSQVRQAISDEEQRVYRRVLKREATKVAEHVDKIRDDCATLPIETMHIGLCLRHSLALDLSWSFLDYQLAYQLYLSPWFPVKPDTKQASPTSSPSPSTPALLSKGAILELILQRQWIRRQCFYLGSDKALWAPEVRHVDLDDAQFQSLCVERWEALLTGQVGVQPLWVVQETGTRERRVECKDPPLLERSTLVYTLQRDTIRSSDKKAFCILLTEFVPCIRRALMLDYSGSGTYAVSLP